MSVRRILVCATATFPLSIRNLLAAPKRLFYTICRHVLPPSGSLFSATTVVPVFSLPIVSRTLVVYLFCTFLVHFTFATTYVAVAARFVDTTRDVVSFLLFSDILITPIMFPADIAIDETTREKIDGMNVNLCCFPHLL